MSGLLRAGLARRALTAAALVALAGACSGGGTVGGRGSGARSATTAKVTTTTAPAPAPLTGLAQPSDARRSRPALVVKVDDAPEARPQAGLDKADVVFEEVVEGGVVRFLAVFHSQDAASVGPVRSVRPVDPDIVSPLGGLFAYSGGTPQFKAMIRRAPVTLVGFDELTKAYTKRRDRRAPSNLFTSTEALYRGAGEQQEAPPALFEYLPAGAAFGDGAPAATHVGVPMGGRTLAGWNWDAGAGAGAYRRTTNGAPHVVEGGGQLTFTNVVVQFVRYTSTSTRDQAGFPVPTAEVIGTGPAWVFSGGRVVKGTWAKSGRAGVTVYRDGHGRPLRLAPGTTWVSLAPSGAAVTVR